MIYKKISIKTSLIFMLSAWMLFSNCTVSLADEASWELTGEMNYARVYHTATKLKNGKVLVAGGDTGDGIAINKTEIFDPTVMTWELTGSMNTSRLYHISELLDDGTVLIAGSNGIGKSAELYDPDAGTWSYTGNTNIAHGKDSISVKLKTGRVLIIDGYSGQAELYDQDTKTFLLTGSMNIHPRHATTATLLQNGQVLVAGGDYSSTQYLSSTEIYDPNTDEWTVNEEMNVGRAYHTATLMIDGKVMVAGGAGGANSVELYDPDIEKWIEIASMNDDHYEHTATRFENGKIFIVGGGYQNGASTEIYSPTTQWLDGISMNKKRYAHVATNLKDGRILVTGGRSEYSDYESYTPLKSCELYKNIAPPASVVITDGSKSVSINKKTVAFTAKGKDSDGNVIPELVFVWTTGAEGDTGIAAIDNDGVATGLEPGMVTITATSMGVSETTKLLVLGDPELVTITDGAESVPCEHETTPFTAIVKDRNNNTIPDARIVWSSGDSGDTGTITIGAKSGIVTGVKTGSATILAICDGIVGEETIEVVNKPYFWVLPVIGAAGSIVTVVTVE